MISEELTIETSMARSEEILEVLANTFGDDSKIMADITDRYSGIIGEGRDGLAYQLATTWLEWAVKYPGRVGKRLHTKACTCDNQWILENEEERRFRPCPRCLPEAHDKWVGRTIGEEEDDPDRGMFDGRDD